MFGISFSEILLISIIAIIVLGPQKLPLIANSLGKTLAKLRDYTQAFKAQIYTHTKLDDIKQIKHEMLQLYDSIQGISPNEDAAKHNTEAKVMSSLFHETDKPPLYQPELDFDKQPELFDEL